MPWIVGAAAVIGAGASIVAGLQAQDAARDQQTYNNAIAAANASYRLEVMNYQNDVYARDIAHYGAVIGYEKETFANAKDNVDIQWKNVEKNYVSQVGTALLRSVQEDIASVLQLENTDSQVGATRGQFQARMADLGVAGNSAALVEGEIDRQGGMARRAIERNEEATKNQLKLGLLGIKAQRDTQLGSISIPTFQPLAPPGTPAPVSPVNPAAPVSIPSTAAVLLNGVSTGLNLASGTSNLISALHIG